MTRDPLAGKRQAINEGTCWALMWPDRGQGCPVEEGDHFPLRSCSVLITKTFRVQVKRPKTTSARRREYAPGWYWRAEFARYMATVKPQYLAKRGGATDNPDLAMAAQDDPEPGTLRVIGEDERDPVAATQHQSLGEQPEPELIPHHEVPSLRASRDARHLYVREVTEEHVAQAAAPLEQRMARLREEAGDKHVDISSQLFVIEKQIEKAERKLEKVAA